MSMKFNEIIMFDRACDTGIWKYKINTKTRSEATEIVKSLKREGKVTKRRDGRTLVKEYENLYDVVPGWKLTMGKRRLFEAYYRKKHGEYATVHIPTTPPVKFADFFTIYVY